MPVAGRARGTNRAPTTLRRFPTFRDGSRWLATPSLTDVEDALAAYAKERRRRAALADAAEQNRRSVLLARDLYVHGLRCADQAGHSGLDSKIRALKISKDRCKASM